MSKLSDAMQALAPVAQPDNWDGSRWTGEGSVRALVNTAIDDMSQVDVMMTEIARATSLPATAEERAQRAIEMAATEMRSIHSSKWPDWVIELLDSAQTTISPEEYRAALSVLRDRISERLEAVRS